MGHRPKVPVEGSTGRAVVSPTASTPRDEMAVSEQRLLAAGGQIPMAAHIDKLERVVAVVTTSRRSIVSRPRG